MNTFQEYEEAAVSTAIYPGQGTAVGLIYCALKGAGEAGEFAGHLNLREHCEGDAEIGVDPERLEIDMVKEVGDQLWYLAAKARELGTSLAKLLENDIDAFEGHATRGEVSSITSLALYSCTLAGHFAELVGKAMRDDDLLVDRCDNTFSPTDLTSDRHQWLVNNIGEHATTLAQLAHKLGTSLAAIAAANIAKLAKRKLEGKLGGSGDNR